METLKGGVGSLCSSLGGEGAPAVSPECARLSWGGRQAVLTFEAGSGWLRQDELLPPCRGGLWLHRTASCPSGGPVGGL